MRDGRAGAAAQAASAPLDSYPMLSTILTSLSVPDIRKKIGFSALMLGLYRFGAHLTAPGINSSAAKQLSSQLGSSSILGFLNLFSGGALSEMAVFALGIMPY